MKKNRILQTFLIGMILLMTNITFAQESIDYALYKKVLAAHVNDHGRVDYDELKKDTGDLDAFITQIEQVDPAGLSPQEQKTFWVNAYNAITLKVVTDSYPVKGIRRINFGLVWEVPRKVAKTKYSLGHIEHKIVRPLGDPRIHFVLNCASIGCPELPNTPFEVQELDKQLDNETRKFINNPEKVRLDRENNILYHSEIFSWFEEDFLVDSKDILDYIKKYINKDDQNYLNTHGVKLKPLKYDWGLNKQ